MRGKVPARKDTSVHLRMQGFHPSIEYLREAGNLADADGCNAFSLEKLLRASRSYYFPSKFCQALHKRHKSGFVAYAY